MSRFYAPQENVKGNFISIDGREAKHILNVMRLKENDKVVVFDGTGKEYTGFIAERKLTSLKVEIVSVKQPLPEALPEITLAVAIPKKEKMDYIVEKATELGVGAIIPVISERTIAKPEDEKHLNKVGRWKKISLEASKQCGRRDVPEIKNIQKFYNAIETINNFDLAVIATLSENTVSLREAVSRFERGKVIVFVGPEGDFTPDEIAMVKDTSAKLVSLGPRVLKSDTAGLYLLSVLNYEFSR